MNTAQSRVTPYAEGARMYWEAGWRGVVPVQSKFPPVTGYTGASGEWPSYPDVQAWSEDHADWNIALRLPRNVIGLDVDAYKDKRGAATLADCESRWGELPITWRSTSRTDPVSGIRLFHIPEGLSWPGQLPGGGVETITYAHRYCVCWPSVHPEGRVYRWTCDGVVSIGIPKPDDLPWLPDLWVSALSRGEYRLERKASLEPVGWLVGLTGADQPPCQRLEWLAGQLARSFACGATGSRHELALPGVCDLVRKGEEGHPGILAALDIAGAAFIQAVTQDGSREDGEATGEWRRIVTGAVALIAGSPRSPQVGDPCVIVCDPPWTPGQALPARRRVVGTPWQDAGHLDAHSPEVAGQLLAERVTWLRADREARRVLRAEENPLPELPPGGVSLADLLAQPYLEVEYRVKGLLPVGGRVVLSAQQKTGKTTFVGNLVRSLADGVPFLGEFAVSRPQGSVTLLDNEMDPRTLTRWLRDMGIGNTRGVNVIPLMGLTHHFDLRVPHLFEYWVKVIGQLQTTTLIIDCLKPILDALGLDEHKDTGQITTPLTQLKIAANVSELILVHHMGHTNERSRGDSALRGWPEVEWQLIRMAETPDQEADANAPRFFKAYGRDVNIEESVLRYSQATRSLSLGEGGRREAAKVDMVARIMMLLTDQPGLNKTAIEAALPGGKNGRFDHDLAALVDHGYLSERQDGRSKRYRPGPIPYSPYPLPPKEEPLSPPPSKGGVMESKLFEFEGDPTDD